MRQAPHHCAPRDSSPTAGPAPRIVYGDSAFEDSAVPADVLAGDGEAEPVEEAEAVEVRGYESRLRHVEVFRLDSVGTSILGRPRPLSSHRHAQALFPTSTPSNTKSP